MGKMAFRKIFQATTKILKFPAAGYYQAESIFPVRLIRRSLPINKKRKQKLKSTKE
jgi:hypothetical protein